MEESKTLILIDGHALAFRCFFALERTGMKTSDKEPTWAVFGFFKAIFDLLKNKDICPDCIAVTFDVSHQTFRTECYTEYKANREQMPDTMKSQMGLIMEGLKAFNIPIYTKEGFEADDVIGTIVKKASALGHKTIILTGDQDAFQIIDRNGLVHVLIPSKGELVKYGWNEVYNKLGIYPDQVIDYKALRGDTSDNIPGVRGIGEKTAVKLLDRFQNLENVLSHIDDIDGKALKEKLKNGIDDAKMSYFLATINKDVDIDFDFDKTKLDMPDIDKVSNFLKRVQFFSFLKNLPDIIRPFSVCCISSRSENIDSAEMKKQQMQDEKLIDLISLKDGNTINKKDSKTEQEKHKEQQKNQMQLGLFAQTQLETKQNKKELVNLYKTIITENDFEELIEQLNKQTLIAIDTETTSVNALEADLVGISVAYNEEIQAKDGTVTFTDKDGQTKSFYIPVFHKVGEQLEMDYVLNRIKPIFENPNIYKTFQNAKYEINTLLKYDIHFKGIIFDTMLASYVNDPSRKHGLKIQSAENLDYFMTEIDELIGKGKNQITMDDVSIEDCSKYACDDAFVTLELTRYWCQKLDEESKKLLYDIEVPVSLVLAKMEAQGVTLDTEYLSEYSTELKQKLIEMEEQIYALAGENFNINSPKQVATILFEKLGIEHKTKKRGSAQKFSTDAKVLEELAKDHEIARCLLNYRHYAKMKTTYVDSLPELISPVDGKIHTSYNQTITVTGRLSSSNPNLQNIPIRTKLGNRIRKAFIPENKMSQLLLSADYSQIELRLLAHCSGDENLIQAFKTGEDIHAQTAAKVFDVPLNEVTKEMRSKAKAVNFGIIYGQTRWGLASSLGISNEEAQTFIDKYFLTYPKVKEYMNNCIQDAYRYGFAKTMYGRKRYLLDELMSSNRNIKDFAQRAAINTPLQGAASDLIKMAMIDLDKKITSNKFKSKMIMQVHDELILEAYKDELDEIKKIVTECMELNQPLSVPLVVDIACGETWMEAEE